MASESEALADIVAEIRAYGAQPPPRLMWLEIADRIEAAARREKAEWEAAACACVSDAVMSGKVAVEHKLVGNAAAMYNALVKIAHYCDDEDGMDDPYCADGHILSDMARAALSTPPRNCDLPLVVDGPASNNADKAWLVFKYRNPDAYFDVSGLLRCIDWLLAPAAEREGEGDGR